MVEFPRESCRGSPFKLRCQVYPLWLYIDAFISIYSLYFKLHLSFDLFVPAWITLVAGSSGKSHFKFCWMSSILARHIDFTQMWCKFDFFFFFDHWHRWHVIEAVVVALMLTFNKFNTLFCCLHRLWTSKCRLGKILKKFQQLFVI